MGVYSGIAQDNVIINSGAATLNTLTVTGNTTLTGGVTFPVQALAATGTDNTNAAQITVYGIVHATGANGTVGVRLPTAVAGRIVIIKNSDAANGALKVYPAADDSINSATATTVALSVPTDTACMLAAFDATNWFSVPLVPS